MMDDLSVIQKIVVWAFPVIFAVTVHEYAHGWLAKRYGDNTGYSAGLLTLNPIKQIDLMGTIVVPLLLIMTNSGFVFGWAKGMPINPKNFKNPRKDAALVALAGPVANLLMAIAWALLARLAIILNIEAISVPLIYSSIAGISLNLVLTVFNLLPIPPLDGSRVLLGILPNYWSWQYSKLEPYGFIILMILLFSHVLDSIIMYPFGFLKEIFFNIAGLS